MTGPVDSCRLKAKNRRDWSRSRPCSPMAFYAPGRHHRLKPARRVMAVSIIASISADGTV